MRAAAVLAFNIAYLSGGRVKRHNQNQRIGQCSRFVLPSKYVPRSLNRADRIKQRKAIEASRKAYRKGHFRNRPLVQSYKSKKSSHVQKAKILYKTNSIAASPGLAKKTGCRLEGLRQIVRKGKGAFYSSGSRPNQTSSSWARARLASSITGGPASRVDGHILKKYCKPSSKPRLLMLKKKNIRKKSVNKPKKKRQTKN